jgi:signal transduction histidine kinase
VTRYDVTELVRLRRLREIFSTSLIQGQNDERRRMAREIHDSTMQLLASIGLALGQLKRTPEVNHSSLILTEIEELLAETQREIRSISYLAHPPALQELGLTKAIESLVTGYCRRTGLNLSFRTDTEVPPVWKTAEMALYRVVQESLSNVHRHAHATEAAVGLFVRKSMIHAVVVDNGSGFSRSTAPGVGLVGMRERLEELGGRLAIRARHPGTAIIASLPIQPVIRPVGDLAFHG